MGCWGSPGALGWDEELAGERARLGQENFLERKTRASHAREWFGHGQEMGEGARMSWGL